MPFDADDLDWAMGELLHLFLMTSRQWTFPHLIAPGLFHDAWRVLNAQPFEVRNHCHRQLMAVWRGPAGYRGPQVKAKRYENALTH